MTDLIDAAAARFASDTTNHTLTVLRDDGLYRHLRFKAPGTGFYWFDLVAWPGHPAFVGDVAPGYVFAHTDDMFGFFRASKHDISPSYWAEKVVTGRDGIKVYSEDRLRQVVTDDLDHLGEDCPPGLREAAQREVLDDPEVHYEDGARQALDAFQFEHMVFTGTGRKRATFRFTDTWEWDLTDWDWAFLWCCHAIRWGIGQYDAAKAQSVSPVPLESESAS